MNFRAMILGGALALAGCGQQAAQEAAPAATPEPSAEAIAIPAAAETMAPPGVLVDADDPAFWADPADPKRAVLFGTDKSVGLYVYNLDGSIRQFLKDGPINNVDVRDGFATAAGSRVLVVGGERDRFGLMTWLLDPATLEVTQYGFFKTPAAFGEPYGSCLGKVNGRMLAAVNNKDGVIHVWEITDGGGRPDARMVQEWKVGTQTEGCVFDDARGLLYVGEEDVGIWRFDLAQPDRQPLKVAPVDGRVLTADVEGLTLMRDGDRQFLIASSQGDSSYAVWRIDGSNYAFQGRFRVEGGNIDPVTQTDGLDAWSGPIGPFPQGALAMHDHCDGQGPQDPPPAVCDSDEKQQNFKMVDWRDVKRALGIR